MHAFSVIIIWPKDKTYEKDVRFPKISIVGSQKYDEEEKHMHVFMF